MIELFSDIRPQIKEFAKFYIDRIFESQNMKYILSTLQKYCDLA